MEAVPVVATLSSGLFAGANLYVSNVEHPTNMEVHEANPDQALEHWKPSVIRAKSLQAPFAALGCVSGIAAYVLYRKEPLPEWNAISLDFFTGAHEDSSKLFLIGGCLLGAVVPFTFIFVSRTNRALLQMSEEAFPDPDEVEEMLDQWAFRHAVRSLLGLAAFGVFSYGLTKLPQTLSLKSQ